MNSSQTASRQKSHRIVALVSLLSAGYTSICFPNPASIVTSGLISILILTQVNWPKMLRLTAFLMLISSCFSAYFMLPDLGNHPTENVHLKPDIQALIERSQTFYETRTELLKSGSEQNSSRDTSELFGMLSALLSNFEKEARRNNLPLPAFAQILDSSGNMIAWSGNGLEIADKWTGLFSKNDKGIEIIELPAGIDIVFWQKTNNGGGVLLSVPFARNSLGSERQRDGFLKTSYPDPFNSWDRYGIISGFLGLYMGLICLWTEFRVKSRYAGPLVSSILAALAIMLARIADFPSVLRFSWFENARLYAGIDPLPELPGDLLVALVCVHTASLAFRFLQASEIKPHRVLLFFLPVSIAVYPTASETLLQYFTQNSSLEWWPDIFIPGLPESIVIVISLILCLYTGLRLVFWIAWNGWSLVQNQTRKLLDTGIFAVILSGLVLVVIKIQPGYLQFQRIILSIALLIFLMVFLRIKSRHPETAAAVFSILMTILTISVCMPDLASSSAKRSIQDNLAVWVEDQDQIRSFALRSNLSLLQNNSELIRFFSNADDSDDYFTAYNIWSKCDLSAVSQRYGVEIRDRQGELLERFAPELPFSSLPAYFLDNVRAIPGDPVILPFYSISGWTQPELIGGISILDSERLLGFLIIRLPAGPVTALPERNEWGFRGSVYSSADPEKIRIPPDLPPLPELKEDKLTNDTFPDWILDRINRRYLLVLKIQGPGTLLKDQMVPFITASLPFPSRTAQAAGAIYLLILCSVLASIDITLIQSIAKSRKWLIYPRHWTFRIRLFVAFTLIAAFTLAAMALIIHRILSEIARNAQSDLLNRTTISIKDNLSDSIIRLARERLNSNVMRKQENHLEVDFDPLKYMILSPQGVSIDRSVQSMTHLPGQAVLSEIAQTSEPRVYYYSPTPGQVNATALVPVKMEHIAESSYSFAAVEIPVTGLMVQALTEGETFQIDIYSQGRIAASSRPELFNTGFLPLHLPGSLYARLLQDGRIQNHLHSSSPNGYVFFDCLRDDLVRCAAVIAVTSSEQPLHVVPQAPINLIVILTVGVFIGGLVVADFLGRRLAAPVQALTEGAIRVSEGNLSTQIPMIGSGELSDLIRHFNTMILDLEMGRNRLQQRHQLIKTLLAEMNSGIAAVDGQFKITMVNRAAEKLLGFEEDVLPGKDVLPIMDTLQLPEPADVLFERALRIGHAWVQTRMFREGKIFHLRIAIARLGESEANITGFLAVMDDISAAVASSKMEAYAELARRVAHEIKNPLTPVKLAIEHLRQTYFDKAPQFPSIFEQCTGTVLEEVKALEKIATEFSRFARMPQSQFILSDIRQVLFELQSMFSAPVPSIEIRFEIAPEPLLCRFDHDQIKRAFINLLQNGIQAMPGGGLLQVEASRSGQSIKISISDTGTGMDSDTVLKLFEPYFSTRKDGIGLGLVITRATIDEHQGEIRVESQPGKGTTFIIFLPAETQ